MGKSMQGAQQTTSQQSTQLPDWVNNQGLSNLSAANTAAQDLLGPYTGATYAQMTPGASGDVAGLQSLVGGTAPAYNLAEGTLGALTGFGAPQINAPTLANTDLSGYMNPYENAVTQSGLNAINLQRQQALNQNADQAISQGAFGGSRQGVQEGVTNAGAANAAGQLASQNAANAYNSAQGAAQFDIGSNLSAQQQNAANALSAAGLNASSASALGGLAGQNQTSQIQSLMAALQGQTASQQDQQNILNANQTAYNAAQQFPLQQLQIPVSTLSATPYGSTTSSTGQTAMPGNSTAGGVLQGLGLGASLLGSGASAAGGGGSGLMGLLSMLPMLAA